VILRSPEPRLLEALDDLLSQDYPGVYEIVAVADARGAALLEGFPVALKPTAEEAEEFAGGDILIFLDGGVRLGPAGLRSVAEAMARGDDPAAPEGGAISVKRKKGRAPRRGLS
jgi:hypothetical protein